MADCQRLCSPRRGHVKWSSATPPCLSCLSDSSMISWLGKRYAVVMKCGTCILLQVLQPFVPLDRSMQRSQVKIFYQQPMKKDLKKMCFLVAQCGNPYCQNRSFWAGLTFNTSHEVVRKSSTRSGAWRDSVCSVFLIHVILVLINASLLIRHTIMESINSLREANERNNSITQHMRCLSHQKKTILCLASSQQVARETGDQTSYR